MEFIKAKHQTDNVDGLCVAVDHITQMWTRDEANGVNKDGKPKIETRAMCRVVDGNELIIEMKDYKRLVK